MATVKPLVRLALAACCGTLLFGCNQATEQPKPGDDAAKPAAAAEKPPAPREKPKDDPAVAEKPKDAPPEKLKDDPLLTSQPGLVATGPQGKRLSVSIAQVQADDPMARLEAVTALGNLQRTYGFAGEKPPDAVIQALAKALKDSDKTVRFQATGTLQGYGPIGVPAFVAALKDDDADVRKNAVRGVGRTPTFKVWPDAAEAAVPASVKC